MFKTILISILLTTSQSQASVGDCSVEDVKSFRADGYNIDEIKEVCWAEEVSIKAKTLDKFRNKFFEYKHEYEKLKAKCEPQPRKPGKRTGGAQ